MTDEGEADVHGTAVAIRSNGILIRGASGAGKSTLALQLIEHPAGGVLVSDDRVWLERRGGEIVMKAPETLRGLLEVRGVGVIKMLSVDTARLRLVVDLLPPEQCPRHPDETDRFCDLLDVRLRRLTVPINDGSGHLRVIVALREWGLA